LVWGIKLHQDGQGKSFTTALLFSCTMSDKLLNLYQVFEVGALEGLIPQDGQVMMFEDMALLDPDVMVYLTLLIVVLSTLDSSFTPRHFLASSSQTLMIFG